MLNNQLLITIYQLPIMSIENPTLVHFRHFRHFSSLLSIFPLYICRDTSTHVMSTLQIAPFLTNKANFLKSQINVTTCLTMNYDKMDTWSIRKKQSQTNPNKAKFKMGKINITIYITKGYENKSPFWVPKKQSQICPISHQRTMNDEQQTNNNQTQFHPYSGIRTCKKFERHVKIGNEI